MLAVYAHAHPQFPFLLRCARENPTSSTRKRIGPRDRHLTMGNSRSKSKETRRDGKEHAAPSTNATGQAIVPPTETTVKKQSVTEPNKVDDHGGQTPAGASGESQLHSSLNISPATCTAEESTTAPSSSIIQQPTMTAASTTRQVLGCPPTGTIEKQFITENKADDHGGQISTGAHGKSHLHAGDVSTAGGSISSTQLVASCVPSGVSNEEESIIAQSSGITQQATIISSAHGTPGERIKGIGPVDVKSAKISPLLGDSRESEGRQSSTNVGKSDSTQKIAPSSSTAVYQDGNSNTTQQTTSSTELAMETNVEGASNMVDMNTSSPIILNDSLEPAGGCGHTQPDKSSTDSTKPSPSTGTRTGGVSEEQDMEESGINPYSTIVAHV